MKQNGELQHDVEEAIKWEPLLNAAEIGVTAKDGVVTLFGTVDSYAKKLEAETATRNISGVRGIIEKIDVHFGSVKFSDEEIVRDILKAFKWTLDIPHHDIKIQAESGWITLTGEVSRNAQREKAKTVVHHTAGVRGVTNDILVKSDSEDAVEKEAIRKAIHRNWSFDEADVKVNVEGNKVTLKGTVHSLYQKNEAERIAWNAPGVWDVRNDLEVD